MPKMRHSGKGGGVASLAPRLGHGPQGVELRGKDLWSWRSGPGRTPSCFSAGHGLAYPECLLSKWGTCPVWEGPLGEPSLGRCRDVLPEEAKDLGWARPSCCCLSCLGLSDHGSLPGEPALEGCSLSCQGVGRSQGAHAPCLGSL